MQDIKKSPNRPGVYIMKDKKGRVIYVGKAVSIKKRLASHFSRPNIDPRHASLILETKKVGWQATPMVIEALILESKLIKKFRPKYNIKDADDKSFLYTVFTNEEYPRVLLCREDEINKIPNFQLPITNKISNSELKNLKRTFGPFTSASAIRAALEILRKIFPFRDCSKFSTFAKASADKPRRPCLQYHLKRCGAPCAGLIPKKDYGENIKNLILFFEGKKQKILRNLKKEMIIASKNQDFEKAAILRNQIFSLRHIQDISMIKKDDFLNLYPRKSVDNIRVYPRIEGYDISNIGKSFAVGSMVVFENRPRLQVGAVPLRITNLNECTNFGPNKNQYRKFRVKTVIGQNDIAMIKEILRRRFNHKEWRFPDLILVDGGAGQVNAAIKVLKEFGLKIPVVGIAKGADRKKDEFIYGRETNYHRSVPLGTNGSSDESERILRIRDFFKKNRNLFLRVRNEAHRFAQKYHRHLREKI